MRRKTLSGMLFEETVTEWHRSCSRTYCLSSRSATKSFPLLRLPLSTMTNLGKGEAGAGFPASMFAMRTLRAWTWKQRCADSCRRPLVPLIPDSRRTLCTCTTAYHSTPTQSSRSLSDNSSFPCCLPAHLSRSGRRDRRAKVSVCQLSGRESRSGSARGSCPAVSDQTAPYRHCIGACVAISAICRSDGGRRDDEIRKPFGER